MSKTATERVIDRRQRVAALYTQGHTLVEIAQMVGVSAPTAREDLKVLGVERRPQGRRRLYGPDVERTCEQCGDSFIARASEVAKGRGLFCSGSCLATHGHATGRLQGRTSEKVRAVCALDGCEIEVERSPSHVLNLVYCSGEHAYADEKYQSLTYERRWPDGPNMAPCSECGRLVNRPPSATARSPHQFCSDECQAAYTKKTGLGGFRALIDHRAGGRARQRWFGRWGGREAGRLGGRPSVDLHPAFVAEVQQLIELGWGQKAIAKRLEATEWRVRLALSSSTPSRTTE
jgi:hypothetical protein